MKNEDITDIGSDKDTDDDIDECELHLMCWMTSILFTREASVIPDSICISDEGQTVTACPTFNQCAVVRTIVILNDFQKHNAM